MTRVALVTSGGDCPGLNAAMRGIGKALYNKIENLEIFGMYDGYRGLIDGDYKFMQPGDFGGILTQGGTILGTSRQRYVPGRDIVDDEGNSLIPAMKDTYNRLNLDCLVVMGGNGTQKSAKLLMDAGMNVVTLPKTIDNDIWGTDTTFGFQSAVDIATNVIDYIHSTASSHSRVFLVELMGRDAGWLTLNAGIGSGADIILIPEIPYDISKVLEAIENRRKNGKGFTILAVAEGAKSVNDQVHSEEESRRRREESKHSTISYEIAAQIEAATSQEARVTVPGHYQRGGPPCPYDRVLATQFGTAAAELIINKQYGRMVAIQEGEIVSIPLEEAASKTKFLPTDHPLIKVARDIGISFGD
ncbi:MAG: 6-phosphofructokinase [Oscillospiraceae bacterium]|nr:6-phosphofructokinase [Oscillospiraceae bacterium]